MNIHFALTAATAAIILTGCQTRTPQAREFVVNLSSATPVSFTGYLNVDGKRQPISGTTPTEYKISAQDLSCELVQGPENGMLTAEVRIGSNSDPAAMVTGSTGPNTEAVGSVPSARPWYQLW